MFLQSTSTAFWILRIYTALPTIENGKFLRRFTTRPLKPSAYKSKLKTLRSPQN